jgi:phosphoribosyl-dephospho-CoA transferase
MTDARLDQDLAANLASTRIVAGCVRVHDILELRSQRALDGIDEAPAWVRDSLGAAPFVTVRRARAMPRTGDGGHGEGASPGQGASRVDAALSPSSAGRPLLAVGVRGPARDQRWACAVDTRHVLRVLRPPDLLAFVKRERERDIPALRELRALTARWRDVAYAWGPAGSVGFELATGIACVTPSSDLDIVLYADTPMARDEALRLHESLADSLTRVDVLIETPCCGFSLAEHATTPAAGSLLLRTADGPRLGQDPWTPAPRIALASEPDRGRVRLADGVSAENDVIVVSIASAREI